jgi:hypothetical protein
VLNRNPFALKDPRNRVDSRFEIMANTFSGQQVHLINTQESTPKSKAAFEKAGYCSIDADRSSVTSSDSQHIEKSDRDFERDEKCYPTPPVRVNTAKDASSSNWDSNWRGLTSYYDPTIYQLSERHAPMFSEYPPACQKSWPEIWSAFGRLIHALVSPEKFSEAYQRAGDFVASFSGVARKDGLLVTYLTHSETQRPVILCNTHLESFDPDVREKQIEQLIAHVSELRQQHPDAAIILGGDFNTPQVTKPHQTRLVEGLAQRLKQSLNAVTMAEEAIVATLIGGVDIDGVYFIAPAKHTVAEVAGITCLPAERTDPEVHWSDHCAVIATAGLYPNSPQ